MWNLGFPELVIIFIVALVIFGPRKLPELGRSLGKGLSEFKKASNELKRTWEEEVEAVKHEVDVETEELKKIQSDLE
ncbi:MAG: twin-arginine translocase TatA/TatE family subunit [Acidobacteria bacterium]|nr:twin-arginine translocase TatA/TatE family subunit [Acidobacteriota bacterium]